MIAIRAITFDLDNTLWEIEPVIVAAEQHIYDWLSQHCPQVTDQYSLQDMRKIREEIVEEHPEYAHDLGELRKLALRKVFSTTTLAESWVERAFDEFMHMRHKVEFYPDVIPALEQLARAYPMASLTNGNADLSRIGIDHHFTVNITARDCGVAKPDRSIFLTACRALNCEPSAVLHIGDDPEHDVLGAANAGLRTIWLNRRSLDWRHPKRADAEAVDLHEVVQMLLDNGPPGASEDKKDEI